MTTTEPSQPLTEEDVRAMKGRRRGAVQSLNGCDCMQPDSHGIVLDSLGDVPRLLAEVDRLRAENIAQAERLATIAKDFDTDLPTGDAAYEDRRRRWALSDDRRTVEAEALRMWPEKLYMGKWDGVMVSPDNALAGQRNAFQMGARFQHELLRNRLRADLDQSGEGQVNG